MGQPSKFKRELEAERRAYAATSEELDEVLQVAQYLALKVESLRSVIATLAMGTELKIGLHGYSEDLEEMERIVLARAASQPLGILQTDDTYYVEDVRDSSMPPPLHKHRKRRKLGPASSDAAMDFKQHFPSSDGFIINPADLFSSDAAYPSDLTWATTYSDQALPEPVPESIDLEALERQLEEAQEVMGKLADTPVAVRILHKAEGLTRGQLERMRKVLEVDVEARTDMIVFADGLLG
ncbi:hypothetical protein LTR91_011957 [Friedmanniomyces endolithicus]|uniref:DUF7071 domain-containing protein n=1 Tax=Friedmanniomyces endolithicus TaxID=329885 RepID=A0AAN6KGP8_9PEZI|nr:hypothetical protein LTR94_005350 [Friedmanniomyces endolithicus]KAK0793525.1 hypothetical protein LTR59_008147 [Friedmanniomyces endolithicus]KAK0801505.1 hypothetical protein LTR38_006811 [Friedmanniomyces endolithicus]KAK0815540.1 hypothetical protein LTR75_003828 [Friedmanniomyces endolithicus]KAK0842764.1 hypothetical protein LTR03_009104 [Friedmanniomyces endolithicus]